MVDFTKLSDVLEALEEAQEFEKEQRELVQMQKDFCLLPEGQWDLTARTLMKDRYRGTFDQVSPILDQISGELSQSQFSINVSPAGGEASEDVADVYAGIIRNIENISNAKSIYTAISNSVVMAGSDGFEITQEYVNANTFDQDILFKQVADWHKSVWFDPSAIKQDKSDADWAVKLKRVKKSNYEQQFKKGSGVSVGDNITVARRTRSEYSSVIIGRLYYKKPITIELIKMQSGAIYEKDEKFNSIIDDLLAAGDSIVSERKRQSWRVYSRIFDGSDWLTDEEETVFSYIPLVPVFGNYSVLDGRYIYFGKTLKLIDAQRGLNFAISAATEDVATSPNDSIWMTKEQAAGHDYSRMNIDRVPVRYYNHIDGQPFAGRMGQSAGNQALQTAAGNFQMLLQKTANMDDPSMGQNPGLQSGAAINALVEQSNNGSIHWFKALEVAICHAYNVCLDAIPRVYDASRQQRIINEDGSGRMVPLNARVVDNNTGRIVELNDLSKGAYKVTCSLGVAFKNKQEKTTQAIIDYAAIDPEIMTIGRDILLKNQTSPGMDLLAERFRKNMIRNGLIPQNQWTEEEAQEVAQEQEAMQGQPPQEDPNMVLARAEETKAQADMVAAQTNQQKVQLEALKLQQMQEKLELEKAKAAAEVENKTGKQSIEAAQAQADIEAKLAQTKRDIAEAEQTIAETEKIRIESEAIKSGVLQLINRVSSNV